MKHKKLVALTTVALTLSLILVTQVQAHKPFRFEVEGWATDFGWEAEVTNGPFDGGTMFWYNYIAEFKGGRVYFFEEWEVWYQDDLVLAGYDEGMTRLNNGKFTGNGVVTYVNPDYTDYTYMIGYKQQLSGTVDFGSMTFKALVQIN